MMKVKQSELEKRGFVPALGLHPYMVKEAEGIFICMEHAGDYNYMPHAAVDRNKRRYDMAEISVGAFDHLKNVDELANYLKNPNQFR